MACSLHSLDTISVEEEDYVSLTGTKSTGLYTNISYLNCIASYSIENSWSESLFKLWHCGISWVSIGWWISKAFTAGINVVDIILWRDVRPLSITVYNRRFGPNWRPPSVSATVEVTDYWCTRILTVLRYRLGVVSEQDHLNNLQQPARCKLADSVSQSELAVIK